MTIRLDVFCMLIENQILSNVDGGMIVKKDKKKNGARVNTKLFKKVNHPIYFNNQLPQSSIFCRSQRQSNIGIFLTRLENGIIT